MKSSVSRILVGGLVVVGMAVQGCNCSRTPLGSGSGDEPDAGTTTGASSGNVGPGNILPPVGIARLEPNRGPTTGGTVMVIRGFNFTPSARVKFGDAEATDVTVPDSQTLSLTTPPGTEGAVNVEIINSDGARSTFANGFTYITLAPDAPPGPSLDAIAPNTGPTSGGTVALLTGDNLQAGTIVVVGGRPARRVFFVDGQHLTAIFPEGPVGTAKVAVTNPDGRSDLLLGAFAYYDPNGAAGPQLTSVMPSDGPVEGGQNSAVEGQGFDPAAVAYLAGVPLTITDVTATSFKFVSPPGNRGLAPLMVTNPDGKSAIKEDAYNYFSPPPVLLATDPASAPRAGGVPITIAGRWFQQGATVTIGGAALLNIAIPSSDTITGVVPEGTTGGPVDVVVTNPDTLSDTLAGGFFYVDADNPAPGSEVRLSRLAPSAGPSAGGAIITAFGAGFQDGITVKVGGAAATDVRRLGTTSLTFKLPPGSVGAADVEVQNPGQAAAVLRNAFFYFDSTSGVPAPSVRNVMPRTSPVAGGGMVGIFGTGFASNARVYFGPNEATRVTVASATSLSAVVPPGTVGSVDVVVANPDGNSGRLAGGFAYYDSQTLDPPPVIEFVAPNHGSTTSSTAVSLAGTGFSTDAVVFVAGVYVDSLVETDREIRAVFPAHEAGTFDVTVTNPDGQSGTGTGAFTYDAAPPPAVTGVSPATGSAADVTTITITGTNFVDGATVTVGGVTLPAAVVDSGTMTVTIPPQPVGAVSMVVTNPDGQSTTVAGQFTSVAAPPPAITGIAPSSGFSNVTTTVQITGSGFSSLAVVRVDGQVVAATRVNSNTISAEFPPHADGEVSVTVANPDGQSATRVGGFTYGGTGTGGSSSSSGGSTNLPPQAVTDLDPWSGPEGGGTRTSVRGRGLATAVEVRFGGVPATDVAPLGSTAVQATTPPGVPGPVDVSVRLSDGSQLTQTNGFVYVSDSAGPWPTISSIFPSQGPQNGGTPVIIHGTRLYPNTRVFVGGREATNVRRVDDNTMTAVVPSAPYPETVSFMVVRPDGTNARAPGGFTYYEAGTVSSPTLTSITPPTASTLGGSPLAGTGSNLRDGVQVLVDGLPADDVVRGSSSRVTFAAPPHASGAAPVTVVNPDGTYATLAGGITYQPQPPVVTSITPNQGPRVGYTGVTITGSGFDPAVNVLFNGTASPEVRRLSPSLILALTPAGATGAANVVVRNPDGTQATVTGGFTYFDGNYDDQAPRIDQVTPPRSVTTGGTMISITGANFRAGGRLLFGQEEAAELTVVSGTELTAVTPPNSPAVVDIIYVGPDGQVAVIRGGFTFSDDVQAAPQVGGASPNRGPETGGTPVILAGANFRPGAVVFFGRAAGRDTVVLGGAFLSTRTPPHAPGAVSVTVTNADGISTTRLNAYTFVASPQILGISPSVTRQGTMVPVTIAGLNFSPTVRVYFGSVQASNVIVGSDAVITANAPAQPAGLVDVIVENDDGQRAVLVDGFEYLSTPGVDQALPGTAPSSAGSRIIILGDGFRTGVRVYVGGVETTDVVFVDERTVTVRLPAGTEGNADIRVVNPDGQEVILVDGITRTNPTTLGPAPTVTGCTPNKGRISGATAVRIGGTNFLPNGWSFFGGVPAATGFVDGTALSARSPAGQPGQVAVEVTNTDGQSGRRDGCFTYTDNLGADPAPLVGTVQPQEGPTLGGQDIVVAGDNFRTGAVVLVGNRLASSINVVSSTRIEARTPPGVVGFADVTVSNADGTTGTLPGGYRYLAPPMVNSVSPAEGPSVGGTTITINGENFEPGAQVRIDSNLATGTIVISENIVTAVTPAGTPGVVVVTVVNPDGQVGSLPGGFAYTAPPVVTGVVPNTGSTLGNQFVVVNGSGFRANARVTFGGIDSTQVQVLSGTSIRVRTPSHAEGAVPVSVTNVDGYSDTLADAFTYLAPPFVAAVSPNSGPDTGGTDVTLVGTGFQVGVAVLFGGVPVTSLTRASSTVLQVTSPPRPSGPAAVTVRNPDGQEYTVASGYYYFPPVPPPRITAVSPNFGPVTGGTICSITGDDFQYGARVFFGATEVNVTDVAVLAQTQMRVRAPAAAADGVVNVRVLNPDGQSMTLNNGFTYMPALALPPLGLSAVTPNRSATAGDVLSTVLGNGMSTDVQFFVRLASTTTEIPVPLERYFSDVAVQVRLPAVSTAGLYDFIAFVPSTNTRAVLASIIEYKDVNVQFTMNRGRFPNDSRVSDEYALLADFNADGAKDIFFLRGPRQSVIYQNRGSTQPGYFDDVTTVSLLNEPDNRASWNTHWHASAADFNLDGFNDVVAQTNAGWPYDGRWLRFWESRGFGELEYGRVYDMTAVGGTSGAAFYDYVIGDLDNADGPDILACNGGGYGQEIWLQNMGVIRDGSGNIVPDANGRPQWRGFLRHAFTAIVNGNPQVPAEDTRGCDLGDFDQDGDLDVVLGNAGNQANRLYVNDIATTGAIRRETVIDDFENGNSAAWNSNSQVDTGSVTPAPNRAFRFRVTYFSDPFIGRTLATPVDPRQTQVEMRIKGYPGGPTGISIYYADSGADCGGRNGTCAQSFTNVGIPTDGSFATISMTMTDAEWVDMDGAINQMWIDFDGVSSTAGSYASATSFIEIDWIKVGGTYRMPQFIDASNSSQFTFGGDTRAVRFVDFDNDTDLDLVMLNYNQDAYMAVNTVDGTGNRIFQNQPSRLCHNATCSLSNASPPLLNKGIRVSVGPNSYGQFGGSIMGPPAERWLDINQDGCLDLAIWWDSADGVPRYYVNRKVGSGAASCTGEFYYKDPADLDATNPLRNLYQASENPHEQKTLFGRGIDNTASTRDHWVAMADMDNDGWQDLVQVPFPLSGRTGQQKRIYIRKPVTEGSNTYYRFFDETQFNELPRTMARCGHSEPTDINGDGAMDLVIQNYGLCSETDDQIRLRAYLNDGAGNFADASNRIPFVRGHVRDIAVADFNGDGRDDIAALYVNYQNCGGFDPNIRLFQHDGTGFFTDVTASANMGQGWNAATTDGRWHLNSMTPVDVDGDGDMDLVFPGGQFYDRKLLINGGDPLGVGSPYFIDRSGNLPSSIGNRFTALDYNNDGKMDLYLAVDGQDKLYENDGYGVFSDITVSAMNQASVSTKVALAAPFVAVRQSDGTLLGKPYPDIFLITSGWSPAQGERRRIHVSGLDTVSNKVRFSDLTDSNMRPGVDGRTSRYGKVVDWDHDGRADVVMAGHEDRPMLYNNIGNAVFEDKSGNYFPEHYMESTLALAVADFDRDGDEDVFMCNYFQQNRLLWNREIP